MCLGLGFGDEVRGNPLRSEFSLCHGRKKTSEKLLVSFLAAPSHHVWTTKRKWLQAIDITLDTHKITVLLLLQFFWVVLPRYECRVGKISKLCQNVMPVMKSSGAFFSCINNLCFLHCDIRIGSAFAKLSHDAALGPTNLPQSLQYTKLIGRPEAEHACLKFPVRGFPSPKKVHFRSESISFPFYILGAKLYSLKDVMSVTFRSCVELDTWALGRCSCLKSPTFSRTNFTTPKSIQIWRAKAGQRIVETWFFSKKAFISCYSSDELRMNIDKPWQTRSTWGGVAWILIGVIFVGANVCLAVAGPRDLGSDKEVGNPCGAMLESEPPTAAWTQVSARGVQAPMHIGWSNRVMHTSSLEFIV